MPTPLAEFLVGVYYQQMETKLTVAADKYLDRHVHTSAAYQRVISILVRFETAVEGALEAALADLNPEDVVPSNVVYLEDYRR